MNILMITPYYPIPNNERLGKQTEVVHYFTKRWVALGHNVLVIHLRYPHLKETMNVFRALASLKYKAPDFMDIDGVNVARIDCFRWRFGDLRLLGIQKRNAMRFIVQATEQANFSPDKIITHFPGVTMWLMEWMKEKYNCPQMGVFHKSDLNAATKQAFFDAARYPEVYSALGFRSSNLLEEFERKCEVDIPKYVLNSGVPEDILPTCPKQYSGNKKMKLLFAGRLLAYKNVKYVLQALAMSNDELDVEFKIVGDGPCKNKLQKYVKKHGLSEKVTFVGRVPREKVFEYMREANVFITVSHPETFGLVYLEAMACGAIVVGCKGTGIAGIVKHGENGFLAEHENPFEILEILKFIQEVPLDKKNEILLNSFNTVVQLGDNQVAEYYLECVNGLK